MSNEMTLQERIDIWKKDYKQVFKTAIEDDIYIWRKIKRSEYREIITRLDEEYEEDERMKKWVKQDEITKTVLLYPEDAEEAIEDSAGISTVISQDCLVRSGFGALSQQL